MFRLTRSRAEPIRSTPPGRSPWHRPGFLLLAAACCTLVLAGTPLLAQEEGGIPVLAAPAAGPDGDLILLQEADALERAGQTGEAATRYKGVAEHYPDSTLRTEALWKLGQALTKMGRIGEARQALQEASMGSPPSIAAHAESLLRKLPPVEGRTGTATRGGERPLPGVTVGVDRGATAPTGASGWFGSGSPATGYGSAAPPSPAMEEWQGRLLAHINRGEGESTSFAGAPLENRALSREEERVTLQVAALLSQQRLSELVEQPASSPLRPYLQLALGDLALRRGNEVEARRWWEKGARGGGSSGVLRQEGRLRLEGSDAPPVRIGLLLPLTGKQEALGRNLLQAAQKAVNDFRDVSLALAVADSGSSPTEALQALERLSASQVEVVVGPVFHQPARAAAEAADRLGLPIITLNPHLDVARNLRGVVLLNAFHPDDQARAMARHTIRVAQRRSAAILAPDTDYGRLTANAFADEFRRLGGSAAPPVLYPPNEVDFSSDISAVTRMAGGRSAFDALFVPAPAEQARLIAPQLAHFGIQQPNVLLLGTALWNRRELLASGTDYLKGGLFCDTDEATREGFRQGYRQAWREEPSSIAYLAYDGVGAVAQAIRDQRLGGPDWRQGLTRTTGFGGAAGPFRFAPNGASLRSYQLFEVGEEGFQPRPEASPVAILEP